MCIIPGLCGLLKGLLTWEVGTSVTRGCELRNLLLLETKNRMILFIDHCDFQYSILLQY